MKKRNVAGLLALALSAVMFFEQPMLVLASENNGEPVVTEEAASEESGEIVTPAEDETTPVIEDETTPSTEDEATPDAEDEAAPGAEDEDASDAEDAEVPEDNAEEELPDTEPGDSALANMTTAELMSALGFQEMELSEAMFADKRGLGTIVDELKSLKADEDYREHEVVYFAASEEEAEQIAACYNGTLASYSYGVGVASIQATVKNAVKVASDVSLSLPAVYPNMRYQIFEETEPDEASDIIENLPAEELQALSCTDEHLYATAPDDPGWGTQWHHKTINTLEAWDGTQGEGVLVAVIDTGIDHNHPDLKDNIYKHISVVFDDEGNQPNPEGRDTNAHGTHCAGIIAATANNGQGISGVAPKAKLLAIHALSEDGYFYTAAEVAAVNAAVEENADVISMSLGGFGYDALFEKAINNAVNAGIVAVAAAGNESTDHKSFPAAYKNVISVAATDEDNYLTNFSNYGSWVDIAAPGYQIYSTVPTYANAHEVTDYANMNGTSMACPVVAGVVALMLGYSPELKDDNTANCAAKIKKALLASTDAVGYGYYTSKNYPLVNAGLAAYAMKGDAPAKPYPVFEGTTPNNNVIELHLETASSLTLKTDTPGAKIYYTVDGKKPTVSTDNLYKGYITLNQTGIPAKFKLQAIAVLGTKKSAVFSQTYTVDMKTSSIYAESYDLNIVIGKSIQPVVTFYPDNTTNKKLDWACDDTTNTVQVNKTTGKITCKNDAAIGKPVTVTATTKDGTNKVCIFTVTPISADAAATQVTVIPTLALVTYTANYHLKITSGGYYNPVDKKTYYPNYTLAPSSSTTQYTYKSSNPKVAMVYPDGFVAPVAKGSANITVTANDGSGKKAVCKVTVVNPVVDISGTTNTGFSSYYNGIPIAVGCKVTVKPVINFGNTIPKAYRTYYKPTNSKLEWSSNTPGVTVSNGKVTCANDTSLIGKYVTITATAKDGFNTTTPIRFYVSDRITKLSVRTDKFNKTYTKYTTKYVTSLKVTGEVDTVMGDLLNTSLYNNNPEYFFYDPVLVSPLYLSTTYGNTGSIYLDQFKVTVSNYDVLARDAKSKVLFLNKKGTAKVTYKTIDGSNKKFTLTISVKQPRAK